VGVLAEQNDPVKSVQMVDPHTQSNSFGTNPCLLLHVLEHGSDFLEITLHEAAAP
jgi:hypothetical protein